MEETAQGLENLHIENLDDVLQTIGLVGDVRVKVAVDFGTATSSVCYDILSPFATLLTCPQATNILLNEKGSHRVDTVAAIWQPVAQPTSPCQLVFGSTACETPPGEFKLIGRLNLMKLHLLSKHYDVGVQNLREEHQHVIDSICNTTSGGLCRIYDPLRRTYSTHTINSVSRVIVEFLRFLLRSTMAHFAQKYALDVSMVDTIFKEKVDVAMSMPTVSTWEKDMLDKFRELLHDAGLPQTTFIFSEAKSAAIFHVWQKAQAEKPKGVVSIIVDIGCGTTDYSCLYPYHVASNRTSYKLGEVIPGTGSCDGSQQLNEKFKALLRHHLDGKIAELVPEFQGDEYQVLEAFERGFELVKRTYNDSKPEYHIVPMFDESYLFQPPNAEIQGFRIEDDRIVLKGVVMRRIFDEWLERIIRVLKEQLKSVREKYEGTMPLFIGLTGWGSLPPYVLRKIRESFDSISVQLMETKDGSAVAQGNFLELATEDLATLIQSRTWYGIRAEYGIQWIVEKDTALFPYKERGIIGAQTIRDPKFPLAFELPVIRRGGAGEDSEGPSEVGMLRITIPSLQSSGFTLDQEEGSNHLTFRYQVKLKLDRLMASLELTIPCGGQQVHNARAIEKGMVASFPLKDLYMHPALMGSTTAKMRAALDCSSQRGCGGGGCE
ncbi:hypothetical protein PV08_03202 [Exophiala spinifera]|uniref:Uncharacterized protein n=1 Tax=Exophiala spinifera TaxID=91928 RepID=A0A0D2BJ23_9EURO|nr:uncharacterized protein PV08_03202 [Exophiala spinifera]KIW18913.1 hypothetical protein PV08_03202 [Exophiala spinifera]